MKRLDPKGIASRLVVFSLASLLSLLVVSTSQAAKVHEFLSSASLDGSTTPPGNFSGACGTAVDQQGDIYVADYSNGAIDVFSPAGLYLTRILDSGGPCGLAVDSVGNLYVFDFNGSAVNRFQPNSYPPTGATTYSGPSGVASSANGVAVDPSNDHLYVDHGDHITEYASAAGGNAEIDGAIGVGTLSATSNAVGVDVYGVNHDVYALDIEANKAYVFDGSDDHLKLTIDGMNVPNFPSGFDLHSVGFGASLAVDQANGDVYVGDMPSHHVVDQFDAVGNYVSQISHSFVDAEPSDIAVAGPGTPNASDVYVTDLSHLYAFGPLNSTTAPVATTQGVTDLETDQATLHGAVNPNGLPTTNCHFEWGVAVGDYSSGSAACEPNPGAASKGVPVSATANELSPQTVYHYRLVESTEAGTATGTDKSFETDAIGPPDIGPISVIDIGEETATIAALINPRGSSTSYHVDYGITSAYDQHTPESQLVGKTASVTLAGLSPETTYHVRFVAKNEKGNTDGSDEIIVTYPVHTVGPPDGRVYEMVTPAEKPQGVKLPGNGAQGGVTVDGGHYFFASNGPLLDNSPDQPLVYRADRNSNAWSIHSPYPGASSSGEFFLRHFAESNLSTIVATTRSYEIEDADTGGGVLGASDFYRFSSSSSLTGWLSKGDIGNDNNDTELHFLMSTPSGDKIIFDAKAPLLSTDLGREPAQKGLYEGVDGEIKLVAVDDSGNPISTLQPALGSQTVGTNALSSNGSRVFFTSDFRNPNASDYGLWMRESGQKTVPIPPAPSGANHNAVYVGATPDGSKVFFITSAQLLEGDTDSTSDLYEYNVNSGLLRRISTGPVAAEVMERPVFVSTDGTHVYFEALGQLIPGQGSPDVVKTFLWSNGDLRLVADHEVLGLGDALAAPTEVCGPTRITPDGRYLAIQTAARLSSRDTDNSVDIYRYDAVEESMTLASLGPAGGNGERGAYINPVEEHFVGCDTGNDHATRSISVDGRYLFFTTKERLVPSDSNNRFDVYEYNAEAERVRLISGGVGTADSTYLDSTPSGGDVFFLTGDRLVPRDRDSQNDVYDARIGGGLEEEDEAGPICQDSDCQGPASIPPTLAEPGTSAMAGAGNVHNRVHRHRHCRNGKQHHNRVGRAKHGQRCIHRKRRGRR